jgi:hypothetical protein
MLPPGIPYTQAELDHFAGQDSGKYQMEFNPEIVLDSWISVISEASFGENTCFISEKSFKPIACYHPFIIAGNKLSLHYMREMGYKTFHPFIDETYDTLECWERMTAIVESLKKIQQIPAEQKLDWFCGMQEILEHNYQVLKNNSVNTISASILTIDSYFKGKHVQ